MQSFQYIAGARQLVSTTTRRLWALGLGGADVFGKRDARSFEDEAYGALCLGAQDDGIAFVLDGDLLQTIEITQGVPPFRLDAGFVAAGLKLLSQDQGEEGAEDVATDRGVAGVVDRPGLEQGLGACLLYTSDAADD